MLDSLACGLLVGGRNPAKKIMPHTVNGIGTHYYGKSNHEVTVGVCKSCGFHGNVSAYNTRLWFVIVFVPIIPLGRKRIVNDCPNCRRHFAIPLAQWEAQKQLSISGAADEFRTNPTPEAAVALHESLLGFHQMAQAKELRALITEKFPADAKLHDSLGCALANLGFAADAEGYFSRAHELRPDLPNARAGVARKAIREGRLEDARALLDFMEKPGAAQLYNLGPLESLADAYRAGGRPAEALDLYHSLLKELPQIAQDAGFRTKVEAAEAALRKKTGGKASSVLPKKKFDWRAMFRRRSVHAPVSKWKALAGVGIVLGLIAVGMVIGNEWVRHHRKIFVVNGLAAPVTVEVVGVGSVTVPPGSRDVLAVSEGDYHVRITGAVNEEADLLVHAMDYAARWGDRPVWIVNPSGAAIFERKIGVYSASGEPGSTDYLTGETVSHLEGIHHPFEPLPRSVQVKSGERSRTLVGLDIFSGPSGGLFNYYLAGKKEAEAVRFAEQHLRARPDDDDLLMAYAGYRNRTGKLPELEKLLASRLDYRPVAMHWHRTYQSLVENPGREQRIVTEYDAMVKKEPGNASLLYLRGRCSPDYDDARRYFAKARETDPKNPFPIFALGYDAFCAGDLDGARALLEKAVQTMPRDELFSQVWHMLRLARGETQELENEFRQQLKRETLSGEFVAALVSHLAGTGRRGEAEKEIAAFEKRLGRGDPRLKEVMVALQDQMLYAAGDLPALERALATGSRRGAPLALYHVLIEQGKLAEASRPADTQVRHESVEELALFVASSLANDAAGADAARQRAVAILETKCGDERRAAALLRGTEPPTKPQLDAVIMRPSEKALLCTALALRFPAQRAELAALARKLNVERAFPFHLIRRATESR